MAVLICISSVSVKIVISMSFKMVIVKLGKSTTLSIFMALNCPFVDPVLILPSSLPFFLSLFTQFFPTFRPPYLTNRYVEQILGSKISPNNESTLSVFVFGLI